MILIGGALTYFNDSLVSEIADVVYRGDLGEKFLEQLSAIDHRMTKRRWFLLSRQNTRKRFF